MELKHIVLLLAVLITSSAQVTFNYQTFPSFTPYAYRNLAVPHSYPVRPLFSYAFQAQAPPIPIAPYQTVPATAMSRMIYEETSKQQTDVFRGFSYHTQYSDGGRSEVIFVTGPESKKLMQQNLAFLRSIFVPLNDANDTKETTNSQLTSFTDTQRSRSSQQVHTQQNVGFQQSSLYQFQRLPAHTSSLIGNPIPLHSALSSFIQTIGESQEASPGSSNESRDQYIVEAQESTINEVGTAAIAPETSITNNRSETTESHSSASNPTTEESNDIETTIRSETATEESPNTTMVSNTPVSKEQENVTHREEDVTQIGENQSTVDDTTTTSNAPPSTETQPEANESPASDQTEIVNTEEEKDQATSTSETLVESV